MAAVFLAVDHDVMTPILWHNLCVFHFWFLSLVCRTSSSSSVRPRMLLVWKRISPEGSCELWNLSFLDVFPYQPHESSDNDRSAWTPHADANDVVNYLHRQYLAPIRFWSSRRAT